MNAYSFLTGSGEMAERIRQFDWATTAVGSPDAWPKSLRTTVATILSSRFPMFLWWGEDLIQFYNDAYRPSLGNEGKHPMALGQKGKDCWPEIWDIIYPLIRQVLDTGEGTWSEDQLVPIYRNGKIEDVYWTFGYSPIRGDDDQINGVLVICTETTQKVQLAKEQAESLNAIQESEERFRVMSEGSNILIAMADDAGHATYFNKAWIEFSGRPMEDLLKLGWSDLIHPEDCGGFVQEYLNALRRKDSFKGQFRMKNKTGEYRWLLVTGPTRRRPDGSFAGHISSSMDITDQVVAMQKVKESELDLRNIVQEAPVGICILDASTLVSEIVNDSFIEVAGKPYEAIAGKFYWDTFAEARPYYEAELNRVVEEGITYYANEVQLMLIRHGKQEIVFVTFVYAPLKDTAGRVKKVAIWVLENTNQVVARHRIEEVVTIRTKELAEANRNLERSNAELSQFAYIASHDLQEPIRKVSIYANMLDGQLPEAGSQAKKYLDKISTATQRMQALVHDVLSYSELSKEAPSFEPIDLQVIVQDVRSEFELLIEQIGAKLQFENLPTIDAIPLHMAQLFGNLVSNALKYARNDVKSVVTISAQEEGPNYHIEVRDNGIGFEQAHAGQIFSIFQRLHRKTEYSGTGIGLAICKKIVQNHSGEIYAISEPGKGATFHVILPRSQGR